MTPHALLLLGMTALVLMSSAGSAWASQPTSREECVRMVREPVEQRCRALFAQSGQEARREACLGGVPDAVSQVCDQFFGQDADFCSVCTASCNSSLAAGDGRRRECLQMCLAHPGCQ